ncbi:Serine/threonine protein kinase [Streptosporangium canum]|uniref:non-specific serine/threonine protein kinase n=1 Tax=Streptosporangium canum TaxID=324952 RepID=A0A1I4BJ65_9ACTN|nr:protein kinase [Streptosporangium canum]SFK68825.1 Serine/threonine protein kinase [Streptosporangium canum]
MTARLVQGRYELRSRLGRGGMGTVWLAWDRTLRRSVALKEVVLAPYGEDMAVRRERALREARAAARIRHPAVVDIYDAFMDDGSPWIVMAYIEGTSLDHRIERQALSRREILSEREIARMGREVLAGLVAVHGAQVLHRDVKPANIIIDPDDRVFLVDFGIARISGESGLTATNMLLGTVEFMAPERIDGHAVGPASDLWSLGVTLFCALEGYSPFLRDGPLETARAVAAGRPPRFRRPGPLADAIAGLLVTAPARRTGAAELGRRLDTILAGPASWPKERDPRSRGREKSSSGPGREARRGNDAHDLGPGREARRGNGAHDLGPGREARRGNGAHDLGPGREARGGNGAHGSGPGRGRDRAGEGRDGGNPLLGRPRQEAAALLGSMEPKAAGRLLNGAAEASGAAAEVLALLPPPRAARVIDHMAPHRAARLVGAMPPSRSAGILAYTDDRVTAAVLGALGVVPAAVRLVEAMTVRRACRVLGYVPPAVVAELLSATSDGRADRLLDGLSRVVRDEIARLAGGA